MALSQKTDFTPERLRFQVSDEGTIMIMVSGKWQLEEPLPSSDEIIKTIRTQGHIKVVTFDTEKLSAWDTGFLIFLNKIISFCLKNNVAVDQEGLPGGCPPSFAACVKSP